MLGSLSQPAWEFAYMIASPVVGTFQCAVTRQVSDEDLLLVKITPIAKSSQAARQNRGPAVIHRNKTSIPVHCFFEGTSGPFHLSIETFPMDLDFPAVCVLLSLNTGLPSTAYAADKVH
jgi:hypothetical protein